MSGRIIHVGSEIPERLYRSFRKVIGCKGTTAKSTIKQLITEYVEKEKGSVNSENI